MAQGAGSPLVSGGVGLPIWPPQPMNYHAMGFFAPRLFSGVTSLRAPFRLAEPSVPVPQLPQLLHAFPPPPWFPFTPLKPRRTFSLRL